MGHHLRFFLFKTTCSLIVLVCSLPVIAQIRLPSVLGDNMVLQQNSFVEVWGESQSGSAIEVYASWDQKTYHTQANAEGIFSIEIPTAKAGGPYFIELQNKDHQVRLENILLGELWLAAGQSNMEMPLKGFKNQPITNSDLIIKGAENEHLRLFTTKGQVHWVPQKHASGHWVQASPETAPDMSALALEFGQRLQDSLKVPVGIIVSAWGGTPIESWIPASGLKQLNLYPETRPDTITSRTPAALYNGMLAPFSFLDIRGFLWYQGESNHREPRRYYDSQRMMIEKLREAFVRSTLPFYFVQIAPWFYDPNDPPYAPFFRETQLRVSQSVPGTGMVSSMDAGSDKSIHPPNKSVLADRLVRLALAQTYGWEDMVFEGPSLESFQIAQNKVVLNFMNCKKLLVLPSTSGTFEIAGADRVFKPGKIRVVGTRIEVSHPEIKFPVAVRYGWKNFVIGNLYNEEGLPASSFRTDDWPLELH